MRLHQLVAAAGLALLCAVTSAHAEKRVALVVGNAAYRHADKLDNPVNDAQAVRDVLKTLGFDVVYGENLDLKGLGRALGQFAGRVEEADVALVYFAGHGATFGDTSYAVPVDAEFASLTEVTHELIPVETLIADLRRAKGVRIAILDACRDNASERELKRQVAMRGGGEVTRGLAPMRNASGLIIAYATQYGATAGDTGSASSTMLSWLHPSIGHSPFTAALLHNIATPGLDVKDMFYRVGAEVDAATGGRQQPEISVSMYKPYVLVPARTELGNNVAVLPETRPPKTNPQPTVNSASSLSLAWLAKPGTNPQPTVNKPPLSDRGWMVQVGAFDVEQEARERLSVVQDKVGELLMHSSSYVELVNSGNKTFYRARFSGLRKDQAEATCRRLKQADIACAALVDGLPNPLVQGSINDAVHATVQEGKQQDDQPTGEPVLRSNPKPVHTIPIGVPSPPNSRFE